VNSASSMSTTFLTKQTSKWIWSCCLSSSVIRESSEG